MPTNLTTLPETGFLRLTQIIGNANATPPIPALIPIAKSTLWAWVQSGRFPRPIKLSAKVTVWRVEDVLAVIRGVQICPTTQSVNSGYERS